MTASISTLPVWKKDSTAAEWLEELAALAREHPERWGKVVVVLDELNSEGLPIKMRNYSRNHASNTDIVGALQVAQFELFEFMKGRRD